MPTEAPHLRVQIEDHIVAYHQSLHEWSESLALHAVECPSCTEGALCSDREQLVSMISFCEAKLQHFSLYAAKCH